MCPIKERQRVHPVLLGKLISNTTIVIDLKIFSIAGDISVHVPAPWSRLGIQHASHSVRAVAMPPDTFDLQSLIIWEILRQAHLLELVLSLTPSLLVLYMIWPNHLNFCFISVSKLPHIRGSVSSSLLTLFICFNEPIESHVIFFKG